MNRKLGQKFPVSGEAGLQYGCPAAIIILTIRPYFNFANERSGYDVWTLDNRMHLLLHIVGGFGCKKGMAYHLPKKMEVDHVRMYKEK